MPGIAALPDGGTGIQDIINTRSYECTGLTGRVTGVTEAESLPSFALQKETTASFGLA